MSDDLIRRSDAIKAVLGLTMYQGRVPIDSVIFNINKIKPIQEEEFEWCHDCKEYDQDKHCCHRWSKQIRETVAELEELYKPKRGEWVEPTDDDGISITGRCSNCGWESRLYEDDVAGMPYCPNCGADMRKESE